MDIVRKSYRIPFRPEYLLIESPDKDSLVSAAQPIGRDISGFRFHLSEEAHALVRAQDPDIHPCAGFCSLRVIFDAAESGPAVIEVERGVFNPVA